MIEWSPNTTLESGWISCCRPWCPSELDPNRGLSLFSWIQMLQIFGQIWIRIWIVAKVIKNCNTWDSLASDPGQCALFLAFKIITYISSYVNGSKSSIYQIYWRGWMNRAPRFVQRISLFVVWPTVGLLYWVLKWHYIQFGCTIRLNTNRLFGLLFGS